MAEIIATSRQDEAQVKLLLAENDLPYDDLSAAHMDDFLALYEDGELVGCVGLEIYGGSALLRSLAVRTGYRRQGLGARLLAAAEEQAASRKAHTLYLLTITAEAFFAAHDYSVTERQAAPPAILETNEFLSLCPASAVCMRKQLAG